MQIETYEIQTVSQDPVKAVIADSEHLSLIEELGLENQKALAGQTEKQIRDLDAPSTPSFRFRGMTRQEQNVYGILCPHKTEIKRYTSDLIPLRVLVAYKEAHASGYCTEGFEVWHPEMAKDDPILVGKRRNKETWGTDLFIIARWGAVLKPIEVLQVEARDKWTLKIKSKLTRLKKELESELSTIESYFDENVHDIEISEPTYNPLR